MKLCQFEKIEVGSGMNGSRLKVCGFEVYSRTLVNYAECVRVFGIIIYSRIDQVAAGFFGAWYRVGNRQQLFGLFIWPYRDA